MCTFRGERESHLLQNIASFGEVSVVPIGGQTSPPRRMHLANQVAEKQCNEHVQVSHHFSSVIRVKRKTK